MKTLKTTIETFAFLTFFAVLFNCTQAKGQVPENVKQAFTDKYPNETNPDWETDAHGNFEAHFKKDGEKYRADFSANGQWIETESSIKKDELPKAIRSVIKDTIYRGSIVASYPSEAIRSVIKDKYDSEEITEVEYVQSATKGEFYDVEFKQKGKNKDVEFRANGQIINQ